MSKQQLLFEVSDPPRVRDKTSSTFTDNMVLPVHRWFRFSAGFSADWVEHAIASYGGKNRPNVLDPFAGSGTTLLASEHSGVASIGIEAHPFLYRIASAKLEHRSSSKEYAELAKSVLQSAKRRDAGDLSAYPKLIHQCYSNDTLRDLDKLRQSVAELKESSPASELVWLTLVGILRKTSHANTAQWQYVLPRKSKKNPLDPFTAFASLSKQICDDMASPDEAVGPRAKLILSDARTCEGVPDNFAQLVICSPPYPNNYDYADATRLEMSFLREIASWGDLQQSVRQHLVRSCSQHVPEKAINLDEVLEQPELAPIRDEISAVCKELGEVRLTRGGKKTYHLMVACYFLDLAKVWRAMRRVCDHPCRACFVIGDSAPYGVYVPVIEWLGKLAVAAGFETFAFEQTRQRNIKWKNRKHRVPLCEGRLWVDG